MIHTFFFLFVCLFHQSAFPVYYVQFCLGSIVTILWVLWKWGVAIATCVPILCCAQSEANTNNYTYLHVHAITMSYIAMLLGALIPVIPNPRLKFAVNFCVQFKYLRKEFMFFCFSFSFAIFKNICILFELHVVTSTFSVPVVACRISTCNKSPTKAKVRNKTENKKKNTISSPKRKEMSQRRDRDDHHKVAFNYL